MYKRALWRVCVLQGVTVGKDAPQARLSRGFLPLLCGIESQTKTTHKRKETTSQNKEHLCHAHIVATAPSIEDALILNAYPSNAEEKVKMHNGYLILVRCKKKNRLSSHHIHIIFIPCIDQSNFFSKNPLS